jgi:hypothetical protein
LSFTFKIGSCVIELVTLETCGGLG